VDTVRSKSPLLKVQGDLGFGKKVFKNSFGGIGPTTLLTMSRLIPRCSTSCGTWLLENGYVLLRCALMGVDIEETDECAAGGGDMWSERSKISERGLEELRSEFEPLGCIMAGSVLSDCSKFSRRGLRLEFGPLSNIYDIGD
jgi:hypothetical protein